MLPIRNISYLLPMCCSFWEKCKKSPKTDLGCSTPLIWFPNNCWISNTEILVTVQRRDLMHTADTRQVEQKPGGRGREWATLGVHPLSWLLSNNRLEKVPFVSVPHTSSNRLLLSNQVKGCNPSVAHSLALPLGLALLNRWTFNKTLTRRV